VPPERLASLLTRLALYAFVAFVGAEVLHAREPANPTGAAFVILLAGTVALAAARSFSRRTRRASFPEALKGRSPPP